MLRAAEGDSNTAVARRERVTKATVGKWRGRLLAGRLEGLRDEPRPGAPRTIGDAAVEKLIAKTLCMTALRCHALEQPDDGQSERPSSNRGGAHLARVWPATASRRNLKLSTDPLFIDKVRDIVGLYFNPPDRALVLCVDEKSQIQALHARSRFCR